MDIATAAKDVARAVHLCTNGSARGNFDHQGGGGGGGDVEYMVIENKRGITSQICLLLRKIPAD